MSFVRVRYLYVGRGTCKDTIIYIESKAAADQLAMCQQTYALTDTRLAGIRKNDYICPANV